MGRFGVPFALESIRLLVRTETDFMPESYIANLADSVAFERYILDRAIPLTDPSEGSTAGRYDLATNSMHLAVTIHETIGMTLPEAVGRLGIRPLCFGAAWKILDLLLEEALPTAGISRQSSRWTIAEKVNHAHNSRGQAAPLSADQMIWSRLMFAYAETEEIRHSLVHRRAELVADGSIVGSARDGSTLRPLNSDEQNSFCHAVQLAFAALVTGTLPNRARNRCLSYLDRLTNLTNLPVVSAYTPVFPIPCIEIQIAGNTSINWPSIRQRLQGTFSAAPEIDVVLEINGNRFLVHLEEAPHLQEDFIETAVPSWAHPI